MFNKALFKQSCKANGLMWLIVTAAVCFMLACVMLISGSGNIGKLKDNIETTIIEKTVESNVKKNSITTYETSIAGVEKFDSIFVDAFYEEAKKEENQTVFAESYATLVSSGLSLDEAKSMAFKKAYIVPAYEASVNNITSYSKEYALSINEAYKEDSDEYTQIYGIIMMSINPNKSLDSKYIEYGEASGPDEIITNLIPYLSQDLISSSTTAKDYIKSDERTNYRYERCYNTTSVIIGYNVTNADAKKSMLDSLKEYDVDEEKYDSFGFTYENVKHVSKSTCITYQERYNYEISLVNKEDLTSLKIKEIKTNLGYDVAGSFLDLLPQEVSGAIKEIGSMDLYGLIVVSIFFKMAGLLLPIIYMIMVSNNLIATQVDTGSMAYILSTSTKRNEVTFTQGLFMVSSLAVMFLLTTITSIICYFIADVESSLTVGKLILVNVGAFLVLFALAGINFLTSCWYDRSKKSMAIGGGLSMFFLVATMLGLFGSHVIPSVIRIEALNNFNYVSIISLFDSVSVLDGEYDYIYKFIILFIIGIVGFIVGSIKFKKKDLPL